MKNNIIQMKIQNIRADKHGLIIRLYNYKAIFKVTKDQSVIIHNI